MEPGREADRAELVFAIVHEIANQLGAIRLQTHLPDDDLDARGLAEASVTIDDQAARAGPLLALVFPRPDARPDPRPDPTSTPLPEASAD